MSSNDVQSRLEAIGIWQSKHALELFEFLESFAPPGAFDDVEAYLLVDTAYRPVRGAVTRDWIPVVLVGDELLVDVSTRIIDLILAAIEFFERPDAFDEEIVFQIHNLAMDFYDNLRVLEKSLAYDNEALVIHGNVTWGIDLDGGSMPFETRVGKDQPAVFVLREPSSPDF